MQKLLTALFVVYLNKFLSIWIFRNSRYQRGSFVYFSGDLQFLLTNVTVYIVDFLVPAVLVTKYYWEFSVEVRRRSGGVTSTTNAPAASNTPQNNNNNNNNNNGNSMQHGNGIPRCNAISQVPPLRASQENRTHSNHPRGTCLNGKLSPPKREFIV